MSSGKFGRAWLPDLRNQTQEALTDLDPQELFPQVEVADGSGVGAGRVEATSLFLAEIMPELQDGRWHDSLSTGMWTPEARIEGAGRIVQSHIWFPASMLTVTESADLVKLQSAPARDSHGTFLIMSIRHDRTDAKRASLSTVIGAEDAGQPTPELGDDNFGTIG